MSDKQTSKPSTTQGASDQYPATKQTPYQNPPTQTSYPVGPKQTSYPTGSPKKS